MNNKAIIKKLFSPEDVIYKNHWNQLLNNFNGEINWYPSSDDLFNNLDQEKSNINMLNILTNPTIPEKVYDFIINDGDSSHYHTEGMDFIAYKLQKDKSIPLCFLKKVIETDTNTVNWKSLEEKYKEKVPNNEGIGVMRGKNLSEIKDSMLVDEKSNFIGEVWFMQMIFNKEQFEKKFDINMLQIVVDDEYFKKTYIQDLGLRINKMYK